MPKQTKKQIIKQIGLLSLLLGFLGIFSYVSAQDLTSLTAQQIQSDPQTSAEIENLSKEIDERKSQLDEVNSKKQELEEQLNIIQRETYSIKNQISAFDNQIQDTEFEIQKKTLEIEKTKLEIERLAELLEIKKLEIKETKIRLSSLIRIIDEQDRESPLYVLFSRDSFSSYLEDIQSAAGLQVQVQDEVKELKTAQEDLDTQKIEQGEKIEEAKEAKEALERNIDTLDQQRSYQEVLYQQSKEREVPYEQLVSEVSKQKSVIDSQVARLESEARSKLLSLNEGLISDKNVPLSWPISSISKPGLNSASCYAHATCTAIFGYDNYYFKGLYHRGVDVAVSQGTPVYAPADAIVAYPYNPGGVCPYYYTSCVGYESSLYLQHIDDEGVATDMYTQYLHLSAAAVTYSPDITYVQKGQVIGYVGGKQGTLGAGFSSGSHLHFAVIIGGRPGVGGQYVNPLTYLP